MRNKCCKDNLKEIGNRYTTNGNSFIRVQCSCCKSIYSKIVNKFWRGGTIKILTIILIIMLTCSCSENTSKNTNKINKDYEIERISSEFYILRDKKRNKEFMVYNGYRKGGITQIK